ncbi:hypothetical protein, partial [Phocaeicola sartorii]|uniref:hypothetical protein n=1 Tax=Phocaeicola sartorii TaxID=671267 RepID=UPI00259274B4
DPAGGSGETASDWGGGAEGSFFPQAVKAQKSAQSSSIQMIFFMLFSSLFMVAKLGIFVSFVILTNL